MPTAPWRTRAFIHSYAPLSREEFLVGDFKIRSRPELVAAGQQSGLHIVDVVLEGLSEMNAEEAHIIGIDTLEEFLDRLSLVSYAPCRQLGVVSTCPNEVSVDEPFNMITVDLVKELETPEIKPEHLAGFNKLPEDSPALQATHLVRQALTAENVEQHLAHLHNAAELIALNESDERVQYECPKCKHTWNGPLASQRAVRRLLQDRKVSRSDANDATEYRGRIAHGAGRRDVAFDGRVTELAGAIEGAVISTIANRAGVIVQRRAGVVTGLPMTLHEAVKEADGTFVVNNSTWKAPARFPQLDDDVSIPGGKVFVGFNTMPGGRAKIDPVAWPS